MAKTCNNCKTESMAMMPIAQHEKDQQRLMSIIKKQFIAIIVLICLLFGSFGLFVWYESQFETIEETYQEVIQEADNGENHFIGGDVIGETDYKNDNG